MFEYLVERDPMCLLNNFRSLSNPNKSLAAEEVGNIRGQYQDRAFVTLVCVVLDYDLPAFVREGALRGIEVIPEGGVRKVLDAVRRMDPNETLRKMAGEIIRELGS